MSVTSEFFQFKVAEEKRAAAQMAFSSDSQIIERLVIQLRSCAASLRFDDEASRKFVAGQTLNVLKSFGK